MAMSCPDIVVSLDAASVIPIWWRTGSDSKPYTKILPGESKSVPNPHFACGDLSECREPGRFMCSTFGYVFDGRDAVDDEDVEVGFVASIYSHKCAPVPHYSSFYSASVVADLCDKLSVEVNVTAAPERSGVVGGAVSFSDSRVGTFLHEENWGIHVPLPAVIDLQPEVVDYQFEVHGDLERVGKALVSFVLRGSGDSLECIVSDVCGKTTAPGVSVDSGARSVSIFSPVTIMTPIPRPYIRRVKVYNCEDGDCSYYVYFKPRPPSGVEVGVLLDGRSVESGDVEGDRIDVTSKAGKRVMVQLEFYRGAGGSREVVRSNRKVFTPRGPTVEKVKLGRPVIKIVTREDSVDVSWRAVSVPSQCLADRGESVMYSVWFDGKKQADQESTHVDFDDLKPGSRHKVYVQAVPRAGWKCLPSSVTNGSFVIRRGRTVAPVIKDPRITSPARVQQPGRAQPSRTRAQQPSRTRRQPAPSKKAGGVSVRQTASGADISWRASSGEVLSISIKTSAGDSVEVSVDEAYSGGVV